MNYVYGPVNSRRLGVSLGVDITPDRVCSFDCIYCEEAFPTNNLTIERGEYAPTTLIIEEITGKTHKLISNKINIDYITFSGSGEPTLHKNLGQIIDAIKPLGIPIAVLTNSSLINRKDVRKDLKKADLVIPSLDAIEQNTLKKVNRPHKDIHVSNILKGLKLFCENYTGEVWLEILLVNKVNDDFKELKQLSDFVNTIDIKKIHLNTVHRGTTEKYAHEIPKLELEQIAQFFNKPVEIFT